MWSSLDRRGVHRRDFLRWMAACPLLASFACDLDRLEQATARDAPARELDELVASAKEALDVFDLEQVARDRLPPAHWGYIATGVDGEETQRNNRAALQRIYLRARRMIDVSQPDTKVTLFGREWPTPIVIAPAGSQRAFHPDGELATARAARSLDHLQALSTVSSTTVEQVNEARGEPVWFQLYPPNSWAGIEHIVKRVRHAGCPVVVLTVDLHGGSNRPALERYRRLDDRDCGSCHVAGGEAPPVKPMLEGTATGVRDFRTAAMTWDFIDRLRDMTDQWIVVKGLMTHEDARIAVQRGVDAIWVSNHGGRAEGSGRATIDALPEIAEAVAGRAPIIVDGGFRRGSDVFKAIARGATAVAIGRPYLWGLGAFGQEGVERVLKILTRELRITMGSTGTPSLADIGPGSIGVD